MKILIVDDSLAMRRIVLRSLRLAGFEGHDFAEAENGKVALDRVKESPPDLVLSDWNMPEMSGIEFLKEFRAEGHQTPFGFITTEGTQDMRDLAEGEGADFLLEKPFTPEQLQEKLSQYIK